MIYQTKIKQDKSIPQTLKILDDEMNIIPTTNKSNFSSKKDLIHDNHLPNSDQTEVRHLENISKALPNIKKNILYPKYLITCFFKSLISNVDNITYTPFTYFISISCWIIYNITIKIHSR